jgi:eukaryotic-like serine/threonine-protein kinase
MLTGKLGRYEILGQLATGGMAEILLARLSGPSSFERPVVIKRILPHLAKSKTFVDMFLDEAQIAAGIRHPKVVQVHELVSDNGHLFLVMEYVEGESLGGIMRRLWTRGESLDPLLGAHIIAEACAGLHAAHELEDRDGVKQHLVHRDMSPQNVMVTYMGEVKVLDFGIAKAASRMARTEAGQIRGKFAYMSPEQCRGEPLDRRSDVFGLGILLYELTVGARLFKRSSELSTLKAICEEPIAPPSQAKPEYPRGLERICLRALAARREDRYRSAAEMRRDLVRAVRELSHDDGLPEEALGRLMRLLFFDRMQQKLEMVRCVRGGSSATEIPEAESDPSVELPALLQHARRPKRALRRFALLGAVGGTLAAVVALGRFTNAGEHEAQMTAGFQAAATPVQAASQRSTVSPPGEVDVYVDSVPSGARLVVGGREYGATPSRVRLAASSQPVTISLSRSGFVPLESHVVPDVNQRMMLHLQAAPASRRAKAQAARAEPSRPARRVVFQRFD